MLNIQIELSWQSSTKSKVEKLRDMKWEVMQLVNKSYQIVDQSTWSVAVYHFRIKGEGWEELLKRRGVITFLLWKGGLFEQFNVTWSGRSCSLWINHIRSWISPLEESQSTISESRGRGEGSFLRGGGGGNNFLALKREAYLSNLLYIHAVRLPKWEISRQKCKI